MALPAVEPDSFVPVPASQPGSLLDASHDPYDAYIAQVLEIIPDVLPEHVRSLVENHFPNYQEKVVEPVLHVLFEDPTYPKADPKGKGKAKRKREDEVDAEEQARASAKPKVDYGSKEREQPSGLQYFTLAHEQLATDFPDIPVSHLRKAFFRNNMLYAPTYMYVFEERKSGNLPYKRKTIRARGKGKGVERLDADLEKEKEWVKLKLQETVVRRDPEVAEKLNKQESEEAGDGIECGCCFSSYPFDKMIQCPEAHLFCTACMTTYSETLLGAHDANIVCMDQSGCKLPFPESELRRFLTPKLLALYDRVKQRKEIEAAGLENLEECPFCDYKVVIDNPQERLFRCENQECGAVTCRACKKPDHLPKSCKEVEDDKKLDAQHTIEEAMTRALMRNCPKCQKAFVKEMGCNKMTCPNCHTLSCYVCRKIITGYDHFNNPPPYNGKQDPAKCLLWDSVEQRHSDEVAAAAKKALEDYKREHPDVNDQDIKIDIPPPLPAAGPSNVLYQADGIHIRALPIGVNQAQELARQQRRQAQIMQQQMAAARLAQQQAAQAGAVYNVHLNFNGLPVAVPAPVPVLGFAPPPLPLLPAPPLHAPVPIPARAPRRARVARRR
ncbi:hypothetical protein BKA93DRAFT_727613 [Sparassis latifolia]